jgi:hypothetical protein
MFHRGTLKNKIGELQLFFLATMLVLTVADITLALCAIAL